MKDAAEFWSQLSGPEKVIIGLGSVGILLFFIWRARQNSSTTGSTGSSYDITLPPDMALGNPSYGSSATVPVTTPTTQPTVTTPTTPTTFSVSGVPFSEWLQSGEGSTGQINQQQIQDYLATGQQYAPALNSQAYNDWLAQGYQFTDSGPEAGNQAGVQAWKNAGYQFLSGAIALGDPLAQPVGLAGQILPAPISRTYPTNATGGGAQLAVPADTAVSSVPALQNTALASTHV